MSKDNNLHDFLVDIANAVKWKKGTSEPINAQRLSEEIMNLPSGSTDVEEKDINFYDYDGTLLFSYTIPEAQALTELPTPKGHIGLIFDGWNWDYDEVIALDYPMDIGAMYRTDDGKTRLYLKVEEDEGVNINLRFIQNKANGVVVDFGDGTSPNTYEELSPVIPHHYDKGEYVLTLQASVNVAIACDGINYYNILGNIAAKSSNILVKVEQGDRTSFGSYAFKSCAKLETLAVHYYKELGWTDTFNGCLSLRCVVYPKGNQFIYSGSSYNDCKSLKVVCIAPTITDVNSSFVRCLMKKLRYPDTTNFKGFSDFYGITSFRIPQFCQDGFSIRNCDALKYIENLDKVANRPSGYGYLIADCHSMEKIVIPEHWTFIGPHDFYNCYALKDITLPPHIESIGVYAFYNCGCNTMDFSRSDVIPALANANAFIKSNPEFRIVVPDNLYDEWIAATNWSTYADRIIKASEYVYLDFADPVVEKLCAENFGDGTGTTQAQANAVTTFPAIFQGNTEITSFDEFEYFENVTSIRGSAFYNCKNLIKIKIPQKTEALGNSCFNGCENLTEINLERVKSLGQSALQSCTSIKEISMPNLVGEIPYMCFYYMSSLEKVLDLGSITVVGISAFQFCRKLTYIKLPSTVVTINNAFSACSSLSALIVDTTYPPTLIENAFKDSPTISIYVPDESVDDYKSATNWSVYADNIKPLSEYQPNNE